MNKSNLLQIISLVSLYLHALFHTWQSQNMVNLIKTLIFFVGVHSNIHIIKKKLRTKIFMSNIWDSTSQRKVSLILAQLTFHPEIEIMTLQIKFSLCVCVSILIHWLYEKVVAIIKLNASTLITYRRGKIRNQSF